MQTFDEQLNAGHKYVEDVIYIGRDYIEKLWTYNFVTGLISRLLERPSVSVQTHTPVTSISNSEDGTSIVHTPPGSIQAKKVVFATNGYTAGIAPEFAKIVPWKLIVLTSALPQIQLISHLTSTIPMC
ncbi:hypothetical protein IFR05_008572 [Cadophora sp. M221]|nr:hypothetical protein IFR05_008572 [Cadophora sp. M221]